MHARAATTAAPSSEPVAESPAKHPLSILALDLRAGQTTAGNLPALLPSLSQATLAQLLERRFRTATQHLDSLRTRVQDTSSRLLITGDLNAGKSTFVNALLRRNLLPVDQQPCTNVFTEVLDAATHNAGVEEVHAIRGDDVARYEAAARETYKPFAIDHLEELCMDGAEDYALLKVYVNDATDAVDSFVRNGLVSLSLIDAPGLNRDTLSTTALFARQAEIDVVVFVVSAENHFTLSAKEFLWNASREKAYVFIVVNKWANIRDKTRGERLIGQQIQQLSPGTWESREELVHYVEAGAVAGEARSEADQASFDALEANLRSFVLLKRAKSKLAPARHYLLNLLADLGLLTDVNLATAERELQEAAEKLDVVKPAHERLLRQRDEVSDGIASVEEKRVGAVRRSAYLRLDRAVAHLDQPAADDLPAYPGLAGLWRWATAVKASLVASLEREVVASEEDARATSIEGVAEIMDDLAKRFLPEEHRRKDERVFRPEAMFAKRRRAQAMRRPTGAGVGLSTPSSLAPSTPDVEVSFLDLFDLERLLPVSKSRKAIDAAVEEDAAGALSVVSLGVGAQPKFGSRAVGVKSLVESIAHVCDVLGSPRARKWAGPIIGVLSEFARLPLVPATLD
jgi:mitofusin